MWIFQHKGIIWYLDSYLNGYRCDEALNLGSLEALLRLALLNRQSPLDDVMSNIIFLGKIEQFADSGGTLGSQSAGHGAVCESRNFLKHNEQNCQICQLMNKIN